MTLEQEYGRCLDCTGKQRLVNRILRRIEEQVLPGAPDAEQYFWDLHRRNVSVHTLKTAFTAIQSFQAFLQNCGKFNLSSLTQEDLEAFVELQQDRG
jgi:hypothetical protein